MAKEILCGFGVDVDAVAGWLGSYGGEDSPDDISRGLFAGEVGSPRLLKLFARLGIKTTWFIPGHSIELTQTIAQADVIWTFTETSCTSTNGGCGQGANQGQGFVPLPAVLGSLTLPDVNSSGTHFYLGATPPIESGDKDFLFTWGDFSGPRFVAPQPPGNLAAFSWNIMFASAPNGLQLDLLYFDNTNTTNMRLTGRGGSIGSDFIMPGCGTFAQCDIGGFWSLVPEPSSVSTLAIALIAVFGFISQRQRGSKRDGMWAVDGN